MAKLASIPVACPSCGGRLSPMPVSARVSSEMNVLEVIVEPDGFDQWLAAAMADHACE